MRKTFLWTVFMKILLKDMYVQLFSGIFKRDSNICQFLLQ